MWNDATYAVAEDAEASQVAGKMGFDVIPQGEGGKVGQVEGWTYLIPAYSKNQEAAFLFIQWMMDFEQQLRAAPERRRLGAARRLRRSRGPEARLRQGLDGRPTRSRSPSPRSRESPQITDILVRELSSYLAGDKSAKRRSTPRRSRCTSCSANARRSSTRRSRRAQQAGRLAPAAASAPAHGATQGVVLRHDCGDTLALALSDAATAIEEKATADRRARPIRPVAGLDQRGPAARGWACSTTASGPCSSRRR